MTPRYSQQPHPFGSAASIAAELDATQAEAQRAARSYWAGTIVRSLFFLLFLSWAVVNPSGAVFVVCGLAAAGFLLAQVVALQEFRDERRAREVRLDELRARWRLAVRR